MLESLCLEVSISETTESESYQTWKLDGLVCRYFSLTRQFPFIIAYKNRNNIEFLLIDTKYDNMNITFYLIYAYRCY